MVLSEHTAVRVQEQIGRGALTLALGAAVLLSAGLSDGHAQGADCTGAEVYLEERFDDNLCGWDCGERGEIADGTYRIRPKEGNFAFSSDLPGFFFGDAAFCIDVTFDEISGEYVGAGLLFWLEDFDNNYSAALYSDGDVWIRREKDGEFSTIKLVEDHPAVNMGVGATNRLMVTTAGTVVTIFVNGEEAHKFRAQRPGDELRIGISVSGREGVNQASFDNLIVTSLE